MTRLADRLLTESPAQNAGYRMPATERDGLLAELRRDLPEIPIVVCDNVAAYFHAQVREVWTKEDWPNVAPPFPLAWYEYKIPGAARRADPQQPRAFGYLMAATDEDGGGWTIHAHGFMEDEFRDLLGPVGQWKIEVDATGELQGMGPRPNEGWDQEVGIATLTFLAPVLLALTFSHAKNVRTVVETPPEKLSRRHRRKRGRALLQYRVLVIDPLRELLRGQGRSEELGLRNALHICRGHFKDFREGKGLFGRHQGLYWWDAQVRGSAARGRVVKDYEVTAPGRSTVTSERPRS